MFLEGGELQISSVICMKLNTKKKVLRALEKDMTQNMKLIPTIFDFTSKKFSIILIIRGKKLNPKKRVLIPILDSIAK